MTGVLAAARLLKEAQRLLRNEGSPAAVDVRWDQLCAELHCPTGPEPEAEAVNVP